MSSTPLFLASYRNEAHQFVPGFGTRPRVIWTPGASGSRIHAVNVAGNDAGANTVQFGLAKRLTLQSAMGTGHITDGGGGSDTITRTSGSFVTDGWRPGDRLLVQGATTLANDFSVLLTAVTALTLTFATGTVDTDEDLPAGAVLYRLAHTHYVDVPAGSGKPSVVAVSGLDTTQMPSLDASPDRYLSMGSADYLTAELGTTLITGETMDLALFGADY